MLRIILNNAERLLERGVWNEDSSYPVLNETARERHNAIALDGLGRHRASQQAQANIGRVVKPEEMLAAPARLHFGFGASDVLVESLDGFRFQINGETNTGGAAQNSNEEEEPWQL